MSERFSLDALFRSLTDRLPIAVRAFAQLPPRPTDERVRNRSAKPAPLPGF